MQEFDVSSSAVSLHIPVHRAFSMLYAGCMAGSNTLTLSSLGINDPASFFLSFAEMIVRVQVMLAQMRAGMWVRNGQMDEDMVCSPDALCPSYEL